MNLFELILKFITWLRINRNASPRTIEQYSFHIWKFLQYLDNELTKNVDHKFLLISSPTEPKLIKERKRLSEDFINGFDWKVEDIDIDIVNNFRFSLAELNLSIKTVNAYMISLRTFFKYIKKQ
jgi:site-specific recombinase XerD